MSKKKQRRYGLNNNDALIPEIWAKEALVRLDSNLVMAQLVHRDFEDDIAKWGDVVNTRRPNAGVAKRKVDGDTIVSRDAIATNVPVPLDQHLYDSFIIYDGEQSKSMTSLFDLHLGPSIMAIAQAVDSILCGRVYNFLANSVGGLGVAVTTASVTALDAIMNTNKALLGRNLVVTPGVQRQLLDQAQFTDADRSGDEGTALRDNNLGRKFGFNIYMSQNIPSVPTGSTADVTGNINNTGGYPAGTTTIAVDGITGHIASVGQFVSIAGDGVPHRIVSLTSATDDTKYVITPGLGSAVIDTAVITLYTAGAVNLGAGYAAGWVKNIIVDGFAVAPKPNQMVAFENTAGIYSAFDIPTTTLLGLGHALEGALANDAVINLGPAGDYCFAFHRNALALVTRPLALPPGDVKAAVVSFGGLSIRVVMQYDSTIQGTRVNVDLLMGTAVLDTALGAVLLA